MPSEINYMKCSIPDAPCLCGGVWFFLILILIFSSFFFRLAVASWTTHLLEKMSLTFSAF